MSLRALGSRPGAGLIALAVLTGLLVLPFYHHAALVPYLVVVVVFAVVLAIASVRAWRDSGILRAGLAGLLTLALSAGALVALPLWRARATTDHPRLWSAAGGTSDRAFRNGPWIYVTTSDVVTVFRAATGEYVSSYRPGAGSGRATVTVAANGWIVFSRSRDHASSVAVPGRGTVMRLPEDDVLAVGKDVVVARRCQANADAACQYAGYRIGAAPDAPTRLWTETGWPSPAERVVLDQDLPAVDPRTMPELAFWATSAPTDQQDTVLADPVTGRRLATLTDTTATQAEITTNTVKTNVAVDGRNAATTDITCHVRAYRDGRLLWTRQPAVGASCSPNAGVAVVGDVVYTDVASGRTTAFGVTDGRSSDLGPTALLGARAPYPAKETVMVAGLVLQRSEGKLVAVDPTTGQVRWTYKTGESEYSPNVRVGNGAVVVITPGKARSPFLDHRDWFASTRVTVLDARDGHRCASVFAEYTDDTDDAYRRFPAGPGQALIADGTGHLELVGCPG